MKEILTLREWLNLYGNESCSGCQHNGPRANCYYKKGYCARYDEYVRDEKRKRQQEKGTQLSMFE